MEVNSFYDKIKFNNIQFPINVSFKCVKGMGYSLPLEYCRHGWHEEIEIKYFLKGSAKIQIGDRLIEAGVGDAVIVNPCETHCFLYVEPGTEYHIAMFNVKFFKSLFEQLLFVNKNSNKYLLFFDGKIKFNRLLTNESSKTVVKLFFEEITKQNIDSELPVISIIMYLLSTLLGNEIDVSVQESASEKIKEFQKIVPAFNYISENLASDQLTLEKLSSICNFHPNYFSRLFKSIMNVNVQTYINNLRINKAETLLLTTELKMKNIGELVGFDDESYFMRWFKKNKNVSPGRFRKNNKEQDDLPPLKND